MTFLKNSLILVAFIAGGMVWVTVVNYLCGFLTLPL